MITSLSLNNLRGIAEGELRDLPRLTVLIGRNGAGKSTLLEAFAIGASPQPPALVGRVVQDRGGWNGASYLVKRESGAAKIGLMVSEGRKREITLRFEESAIPLEPGVSPVLVGPCSALRCELADLKPVDPPGAGFTVEGATGRTVFDLQNQFQATRFDKSSVVDGVSLVHTEASRTHPLWRQLGDAIKSGRGDSVFSLLRGLLGPDFRDLYPIPEGDSAQSINVHLRYSWGSMPVDVAGDGVRSLIRIALELAGRPESLILLEEPEAHLHHGALDLAARAILQAVERKVQVVLSTHSVELLDALVREADESMLAEFATFRVALRDGQLRSHRIEGPKVRALRLDLAEELR